DPVVVAGLDLVGIRARRQRKRAFELPFLHLIAVLVLLRLMLPLGANRQQVAAELNIEVAGFEAGRFGPHDEFLASIVELHAPRPIQVPVQIERGWPTAKEAVEQGIELISQSAQRMLQPWSKHALAILLLFRCQAKHDSLLSVTRKRFKQIGLPKRKT